MDMDKENTPSGDSSATLEGKVIASNGSVAIGGNVDRSVIITGGIVLQGIESLKFPPPPPQLPPNTKGFIARQLELDYFANELSSRHIASIVGEPGVGKTWLAAQLVK